MKKMSLMLLGLTLSLRADSVTCGGTGTTAFDPFSAASNGGTYIGICSASLFPDVAGVVTSIAFQSAGLQGTPPSLGSFIYVVDTPQSPLSPPATINDDTDANIGRSFYLAYQTSSGFHTQASQNGTFDNVFTFLSPVPYDPTAGNFEYQLGQETPYPTDDETGAIGLQSGPSPTAGQAYSGHGYSETFMTTGGYGLLVQINFIPDNSGGGSGPGTVPEPGTWTLFALGGAALFVRRLRDPLTRARG